jgi:hypothetical protein
VLMDPLAKARKAKELQEDPLFASLLGEIEARYISDWRNTQPAETGKREAAYAGLRAIEDLRNKLGSTVSAPKVEAYNNRNAKTRKDTTRPERL